MKLTRVEEWIGLWMVIAIVNNETSLDRLKKICEATKDAVRPALTNS